MTHGDSVVVTGLGAVSSVGLSAAESFRALCEGKSGVRYLEGTDFAQAPVRIGALVHGFDGAATVGRKENRRQARFTKLAIAASREAIADAALQDAGYAPDRIATIIGVGFGGMDVIEEMLDGKEKDAPPVVTAFAIPAFIPNMAAGLVAIEANARGPAFCTVSACASSAHAIGEALAMLRRGACDAAIVGGTEAALTRVGLLGFARMGALATQFDRPESASRPFDRRRSGFVMGEGACILVLERCEAARRRGARIYAELAGYGTTNDAFHITMPREDGEPAARAIEAALVDARISTHDVDYVNAHGTGTVMNDLVETRAVKRAFGDRARKVWLSSTKSMTGHLLGAAGAFEAMVTTLALYRGVVPPTINLEEPDVECDLDYVPHTARERRLRAAVSQSFGFGGHNVALAFKAAEL